MYVVSHARVEVTGMLLEIRLSLFILELKYIVTIYLSAINIHSIIDLSNIII